MASHSTAATHISTRGFVSGLSWRVLVGKTELPAAKRAPRHHSQWHTGHCSLLSLSWALTWLAGTLLCKLGMETIYQNLPFLAASQGGYWAALAGAGQPGEQRDGSTGCAPGGCGPALLQSSIPGIFTGRAQKINTRRRSY